MKKKQRKIAKAPKVSKINYSFRPEKSFEDEISMLHIPIVIIDIQ